MTSDQISRTCLAVGVLTLSLMSGGCVSRFGAAPVPPLATLPASAPTTQRLVFERDTERRQLLAVLRHDDSTLRMALLSPQGQRLLTLEQNEKGVRFLPGALFEPPFSAQWLLERLSWSLWTADQLQQTFAGSAWSVRENDHGHDIYYRKRLVARITDQGHCHIIDDLEAGYRLFRTTLALNNANPDEQPCPAI